MTKEKILENYRIEGECWIWKTGLFSHGYGQVRYEGKMQVAHRVVYELTRGKVPEGMCVCHTCDTPSCVNPDHLFLGTQKDNMQDAVAKGRMARGENVRQGKLAEKDVKHIRQLLADDVSHGKIARLYGVSPVTITHINTGYSWGWLK